MSVVPRLFELYNRFGMRPLTGYSSHHMHDWRDAPFTRFLSGDSLVGCAGLALEELLFLEGFREHIRPRNIMVVGNAHGWSTIFLALLFPEARVVALDIERSGVELTNSIAAAGELNVIAVVARSPDHLARVHADHLNGPIDFALIDAVHTGEAIRADHEAISKAAAPDAVHVFHDVINHGMIEGFKAAARADGRASRVCTRTPSGISILFNGNNAGLAAYLDCFSDDPEVYRLYREHVSRTSCDPLKAFIDGFGR